MNMTSLFPRVFSLFRLASFPAGLAGLALICCLLCQAAPVRAATIVYPDDGTALANVPGLGALTNSLFPGTSLSGNSVTVGALNGAATPNYVLGGVTAGADVVENNRVFINSGAGVTADVFGGLSENGEVRFNSVVMSGGTVSLDVYGGYSTNAAATNNSVVMSGGTVDGYVYGGYSPNVAVGYNSVVISGGTVGRSVFGGHSISGGATNNSVVISGGTVSGNVYGGASTDVAVGYNSVIITGGTVGESVYGGYSLKAAATNNSVVISGGTVGGNVYGGLSGANAATTHNTITLAGSPNLTAAAIYGGLAPIEQNTGNTLNSFGFSGSVKA